MLTHTANISPSRSPDLCHFFDPDSASKLIGKWYPGEPIRRTYRFQHLQTIADGSDKRGTAFLKQYFANKRLSSSDLNRRNATLGCNLVCAAAQSGDEQRVEMLLDKGVNPNGCHGYDSPLHTAVRQRNVPMVKILLSGENGRKKTDINVPNGYRDTPLHLAAEDGQIAIMQHLLAHGAFAEAKNDDEKTPLDLANASNDGETRDRLRAEFRRYENSQTFGNLLRKWSQVFRSFWRQRFIQRG